MGRRLENLFSSSVVAIENRGVTVDESFLSEEEQSYLENVSQNRRREFTAGRECAQLAMETLTITPSQVPAGEKGEPIWPATVVGSITHSRGYAAAAVAKTSEFRTLGLDAEIDEPLPEKVLSRIGDREEKEWVQKVKGSNYLHPGKILFSAKEATFKAWYPVTHQWLGFQEAHIDFHSDENTFTVQIQKKGPFKKLFGKFAIQQGIILTAIEVPIAQSEN